MAIASSSVNKVVDKVYVINLDRDTERLNKITEQLNRRNIAFTRFPAILGSQVKQSTHLTELCLKYCTDGMKGCALSHKMIWEDMLKNGYERVLVLEDDAVFADDFEEHFSAGWEQIPKDFDIWYLGCNFKCNDTKAVPKFLNDVVGHTPKQVDTHIQRVFGSVGTHGYVISNKCARAFQHLPIYTHIDLQMTLWLDKYGLIAYSSRPLIIYTPVEQGNAGSNLAESYPYLLNSALRQVPFSDDITLDWTASENFAKIGGHNVNALIAIMVLLVLVVYPKYYFLFGLWLLIEFIYSRDAKNTLKFAMFISGAMLFKWLFNSGVKEAGNTLKKTGVRIADKVKAYFH